MVYCDVAERLLTCFKRTTSAASAPCAAARWEKDEMKKRRGEERGGITEERHLHKNMKIEG